MSSRGPQPSSREPRRAVAAWAGWWLAMAVLWIAIDDTRQIPELVLGALTATVCATAVAVAIHQRPVGVELPGRLIGRAWKPLWRLVADTGLLAAALFRRLVLRRDARGSFRAVRFAPGEGPAEATRRALAEGLGSLAANRYVVGIDEEEGYLLVHELVRSDKPLDPMGLG